jgi:hypothetical protein
MKKIIKISSGATYSIDRTLPEPLTDRILTADWNCFCDKIDSALEPMNALKKKNSFFFAFTGLIVFLSLLAVALSAFCFVIKPTGAVVIVLAIIFLYFLCKWWRRVKQKASNVIADVNRDLSNVCSTENARSDGITFCAKFEVNFCFIPSAEFRIEYIVRSSFEGGEEVIAAAPEAQPVFAAVVAVEDVTPMPSAPPIEYK